jgi:hypothetical protein
MNAKKKFIKPSDLKKYLEEVHEKNFSNNAKPILKNCLKIFKSFKMSEPKIVSKF